MRRFYRYQLWFLIPGLVLIWLSYYLPASYLYRQLYWVKTEALVTGQRLDTIGSWTHYYLMDYSDSLGTIYHIEVDDENTRIEGRDSDHVAIYYDPSSPTDFLLANPGHYLMVIFLPMGLLCLYLGWPRRE